MSCKYNLSDSKIKVINNLKDKNYLFFKMSNIMKSVETIKIILKMRQNITKDHHSERPKVTTSHQPMSIT